MAKRKSNFVSITSSSTTTDNSPGEKLEFRFEEVANCETVDHVVVALSLLNHTLATS
jgi:hypothetical protein